MSPGPETLPPLAAILVVDDEEVIRLALEAILRQAGYAPTLAANATEALEFARRQTFALILTDQRMPGLTGSEMLAQIKEIQPDATRVLMTGVLELNTVVESINTGEIFRFIIKPWLREELLATIQNGVNRYELVRRNAELCQATRAMNMELARLNQNLSQQVEREHAQNHQLELLNHALGQNLHRSIELCLKMMEIFYPAMGAQARKTAEICAGMAEVLHLPSEQAEVLHLSALLHDIGLVGVPRRIIKLAERSPLALSRAEVSLIEHHPILGQELAGFVHHLAEVGVIIRSHHERFDGQGYPDQMTGDEIPWLSRILAVAIFAAENEQPEALQRESLERASGSRYDPDAVRAYSRYQQSRIPAADHKGQQEFLLQELQPGMVLARGVYNASGLLLLPAGQVLNEMQIDKLLNHNRVNRIRHSIMVYC